MTDLKGGRLGRYSAKGPSGNTCYTTRGQKWISINWRTAVPLWQARPAGRDPEADRTLDVLDMGDIIRDYILRIWRLIKPYASNFQIFERLLPRHDYHDGHPNPH